MGYTIEQLEKMGAVPTQVSTKKGYTIEELNSMGAIPNTPEQHNNLLQKFAQNVLIRPAIRTGEAIGALGVEAFGTPEMKKRLPQAISRSITIPFLGTTPGQKQFGQGGEKQIALETGKTALDVATTMFPGTGTVVKEAGTKLLTKALPKLIESKAGRIIVNGLPKLVTNVTGGEAYNTAYNVLNEQKPIENAGVAGVASAILPVAGNLIGKGISKVAPLVSSKLRQKEIPNAINELEQKYTEWITGTKPGKKLVNKVTQKTEMLNKAGTEGKTPMRTLAEGGIVPKTQGVKFDTFDQAQNYRNEITPLREANRQALQEAGLSTIPTDLSILEKKAIEISRTKENINSGRASKMEQEIRNEFNILRNEYPDGKIPLGLQDEIKSARWENVFKNKGLIDTDVLKKDSEYAIAKAFQKNIEEVAQQAGHTEVAQLNREIGDRLEASKFLESLDGKVLKGGRVGKYLGTLIGSSLGETIPGKIIGAVGGNFIADQLIKSSVNSPIRRAILSNLQKTDPEAYSSTIKWLEKQDIFRKTRLALPAGNNTPIINQGRPIKVFPRGSREYVGGETVIGGYEKSPTVQQTNPAITNVIKNPIYKTRLPQTNKKVNIFNKK